MLTSGSQRRILTAASDSSITEKLALLPAISTLQPRGFYEQTDHLAPNSTSPSSISSPRGAFSFGSAPNSSTTSFTSYSSNGSFHDRESRNHSPDQRIYDDGHTYYQDPHLSQGQHYYRTMNATQHYAPPHAHHGYVHDHHGSSATGAPAYAQYAPQLQPPMLPPTVSSYGPPTYYYPQAAGPGSNFSQPMSLANMTSGPAAAAAPQPTYHPEPRQMDQTGQLAPPGVAKPKITATLWEDEGTVCFQVEVDGICVARRADNAMVNGTKLLNVARMTRGRRDGILKSEKHRKVIKIGPMHLKGVWIPFDRALEFANKEKITEQLYPLFVHQIGDHIHQPAQPLGSTSSAAHRRAESRDVYARSSASQTPAMVQHPLMQSPISLGPSSARPGIDRAHTFPTPPTSASAVGLGSSGGSYDWSNHSMSGHPVSMETSLHNAKSMPTTPATTPPDNLHIQYPAATQASYDTRHVYSGPSHHHQSPYTIPPNAQYGYGKADMAPPMRANTTSDVNAKEEEDAKSSPSYTASENHGYTYQGHPVAAPHDHSAVPPMTEAYKGSPISGRATPRTLGGGYVTPQRSVMPTGRGNTMPATGYAMGAPATPQSYYAPGNDKKRLRDAEDDDIYAKDNDLKRQKSSIHDSGIASQRATPLIATRPQSMIQRH